LLGGTLKDFSTDCKVTQIDMEVGKSAGSPQSNKTDIQGNALFGGGTTPLIWGYFKLDEERKRKGGKIST